MTHEAHFLYTKIMNFKFKILNQIRMSQCVNS